MSDKELFTIPSDPMRWPKRIGAFVAETVKLTDFRESAARTRNLTGLIISQDPEADQLLGLTTVDDTAA